jgi:hypothetical protein
MPFDHPSFGPPPQSVSPARDNRVHSSIKAVWRGLVSSPRSVGAKKILPIMLAAAALCTPCVVNAQQQGGIPVPPPMMRVCDSRGTCGTWTWNNGHYDGAWPAANVTSTLTVESFSPTSVIIRRTDTSPKGRIGLAYTYSGTISGQGNSILDGVWKGVPGTSTAGSSGNFTATWGEALNTNPRGNEAGAKQQPTQAADWTKEPIIMAGHEPVVQDFHLAGKLNLSGLWQASKLTPNKKEFIVIKFEIRQQEDDSIELVNAYAPTGWAGVTTFKGKLEGSEIKGMGVGPDSTATNVHLTQPGGIHVDDPDHIHVEVGDKMPLYRLNPRADDAPCDTQNSAHVNPGWAYARGRDAKWVKKDNLKAACWFQIAALNGMAAAQAMLAQQYYNGEGVATNYDQSFAWAQKSTARNNMLGEWILSNLYDQGKGVPADKRKAQALRERIAQQKINTILSNPDARTPSGLTVREVIGTGLALSNAMIKSIDDDGLRSDCAIGVRSACDALRSQHQ